MLLTWTLATVSVGAFMLLARVEGRPDGGCSGAETLAVERKAFV
jgi:hypothetical protein